MKYLTQAIHRLVNSSAWQTAICPQRTLSLILVSFALTSWSSVSPAAAANRSWRVGDTNADFTRLWAALDSDDVQDGDTIYIDRMYGAEGLYTDDIDKRVVVIGPGYDDSDKRGQVWFFELTISAEGAEIIGLNVFDCLSLKNTNIKVSHCKLAMVDSYGTNYDNDGCHFDHCKIGSVWGHGEDGSWDWTFDNCLISSVYNLCSATFRHNTFTGGIEGVSYSTFIDNVLFKDSGTTFFSNCTDLDFDHNICIEALGGDNLVCSAASDVFACASTGDTYYLPAGLAIGYATDGTFCGAYGGSSPYVPNGVHSLYVENPATSTDPEPDYPDTPIATASLDGTLTTDWQKDIYGSLGHFVQAIAGRGIMPATQVAVAAGQYEATLTDDLYTYIQTAATTLTAGKTYFYMTSPTAAVFNFVLDPAFAQAHAAELEQVGATLVAFANHVITSGITIYINGNLYVYTGFQVEPNDLLNLKNLYNATNGTAWKHPWSFADNGRSEESFPGVGFAAADDLGLSRVLTIDLAGNNLAGNISLLNLHLPRLTDLNLADNRLTGDLTPMVSDLSALKSLDISGNMLTGLTALPVTVTSLTKGRQFYGDDKKDDLDKLQPVTVYISRRQRTALPSILTFDPQLNKPAATETLLLTLTAATTENGHYAELTPVDTEEGIYTTEWPLLPMEYTYPQDFALYLRTPAHDLWPAVLHYEQGDADMSGYTDLIDVQTTITRILNPALINLFNRSAANTYADSELNVQDVVCTVNIVLDHNEANASAAEARALAPAYSSSNRLYNDGMKLCMDNTDEVGAIEVTLKGAAADEVSLLLDHKHFRMASRNTAEGSRHIIFSLTGQRIPAGTTDLLRLSRPTAYPVQAMLASPDARRLHVELDAETTGIEEANATPKPTARFEAHSLVVSLPTAIDATNVTLTQANGATLLSSHAIQLPAGETKLPAHAAPGVYIVSIQPHGQAPIHLKVVKR